MQNLKNLRLMLAGVLVLLLLCSPSALCENAGESVIVVYNSNLPASKSLAEYYAQKRQVPTAQVFGLNLTTNEDITRTEFRDSLQKPLAKMLNNQKLWRIEAHTVAGTNAQSTRSERRPATSKIRYAVLCWGVPLRILPESDLKEEGTEKLRPEMRRNEAAVDSELALLPLVEDKLVLAGPLRNPVYTATNTAWLNPTNGILMVARLDGPTPELARGLVDRALEAETNGLWGRAYFDLRNTSEPGYKQGDDWIHSAAEICRRVGFETVVDQNPDTFPAGYPLSQIAFYAGWYQENASGPFAQPKIEFMPGAFAYHLHSSSAASVRTSTKFWVGPFVAKGVTATMGCVFEPYLTGTPDVGVFTVRFVYTGFTFGESAYAAQPVLSWQTTVVGDPLYRPFGRDLEQLHDKLKERNSKLVDWYYLRLADLNLVLGKPAPDVLDLLEKLPETKGSAILTEKLGDIYQLQGKPSSAVFEYKRALELNPSPQQAVRLLLTLGEKQLAGDQSADAYESYSRLLKDDPSYPDKLAVHQKLLALARKLNRAQDAEKWEAAIRDESRPAAGK